jgi:hypothetical protein
MIENPVPWPDGASCAGAIAFDMDEDNFLQLEHPDEFIVRFEGTIE